MGGVGGVGLRMPSTMRLMLGLDEVEKQLKFDDMEPLLKSQYLKILRDLNADEDPLQSTWRDGEATGLHKGFLVGL